MRQPEKTPAPIPKRPPIEAPATAWDAALVSFEPALAAWIAQRRWFRTKSKKVQSTRVSRVFPLGDARIVLLDVTLDDGTRDLYVVPLAFVSGQELRRLEVLHPHAIVAPLRAGADGAVVDALALEPFLLDLFVALARGLSITSGPATLRFVALEGATAVAPAAHARTVDAEQTNTSVLYEDRFVAKLLRKLDPGESPDLEMGRFLTSVGRTATPPLAGYVEMLTEGEAPSTVALVHRFVANQGDAWAHALSVIEAFLSNVAHRDAPPPSLPEGGVLDRALRIDPAAVEGVVGTYASLVEKLGRRVGAMHVALASKPGDAAFAPQPLGRETRARIVEAVRRDLDGVLALLGRERGLSPGAAAAFTHVAARRAELAERLDHAATIADAGVVTRVHGDLHLGQVLFTGDDFVIIDFEGEPARPLEARKAKRSPLVDVAGMLRSFHYAVVSAVRRRPEAARPAVATWASWLHRALTALFVRGWLAEVEKANVLPRDPQARRALLDLFLVEKAVYEVRYELDNRPDWIDIPLEGLRDLALGGRTTSAGAAAALEAVAVTPVVDASPSLLDERALDAFHEGRATHAHEVLGAHPHADGSTTFAVWAPRAYGVSVVGEWPGAPPDGHALQRVDDRGVFAARIAGARAGHRYALRIATPDGSAVDKADPFARIQENGAASVVAAATHPWNDAAWMSARKDTARRDRPMSIYEVHLGSWRRVPEEGNRPMRYREIARPLAEHARAMGFTHVELMPLLEHPYYGSWGYGVTGFFAATQRYGSPEDLAYLVDVLHQHGLGVIFDWVPAHFALDPHGLVRFDGSPLFEVDDPARAVHPTWKTGLFDYAKPEVRSFLLSSATYWIETFHADGLRVDGVEAILYRDHGRTDAHSAEQSADGIAFLRDLTSTLKREHPDVWLVAEDSSSWPGVTRAPEVGGLGFDLKWDMGFSHDMRRYLSIDPLFRSQHQGALTFRSVYAANEAWIVPLAHDDVAAIGGTANRALVEQVHGDAWQKHANLRLLYAALFAQPGKKLLFMGNEIAQPRAWHHDTSLDWHLATVPPHDGIVRLVRDLNRLHRELPALHARDDAREGFAWIDASNAAMSIAIWLRRGASDEDLVVCAFNFTPVPRYGYRIGVPRAGVWREVMNTDAHDYGGSGHGNLGGVEAVPYPWNEQRHSIVVTLPPLAAIFFAL